MLCSYDTAGKFCYFAAGGEKSSHYEPRPTSQKEQKSAGTGSSPFLKCTTYLDFGLLQYAKKVKGGDLLQRFLNISIYQSSESNYKKLKKFIKGTFLVWR